MIAKEWNVNCGRDKAQAVEASEQYAATINVQMKHGPCDPDDDKVVNNPLPIICVINGNGACGKGTFIKFCDKWSEHGCVEFSSIDPPRDILNQLLGKYDQYVKIGGQAIIDEKGDAYRAFLHDIKMLWEKYYNGASRYSTGIVMHQIRKSLDRDSHQKSIIFINIREPEYIKEFIDAMHTCGLTCVKLLITRDDSCAEWTNEGDKSVNDIEYDIVIANDNLLGLEINAFKFVKFTEQYNRTYGISPTANLVTSFRLADNTAMPLDFLGTMFTAAFQSRSENQQ